jgi:hypothetical protein
MLRLQGYFHFWIDIVKYYKCCFIGFYMLNISEVVINFGKLKYQKLNISTMNFIASEKHCIIITGFNAGKIHFFAMFE